MIAVRKKPKSIYLVDDEVNIEGYVRLIEGIIIGALDKVSISAKWQNRMITESMIRNKMVNILDIKDWLDSESCDIWLAIYSKETGRSRVIIKKGLKRIMRVSIRYINKLCKDMGIDLKQPMVIVIHKKILDKQTLL